MTQWVRLKYVVLCSLIALVGCEPSIGRTDIIGVYSAQYPYGTEHLKVLADGRYEQYFASLGEAVKLINTGTWELQSRDKVVLVLNNPIIVDDGFGNKSAMAKHPSAYWPLGVTRSLGGKVRLCINEDQNFVFNKIN
ncbi:MAG: hypothetical protein NTY01_07170 [Verrucomicrobia bacterium]|nr:hypothetical protein [Verrucomicrobiota bacterium]